MPTRQEFLTNGRVRLLIERDPGPFEVANRLYNTDGHLGGYGWLTPVAGTQMGTNVTGDGQTNLELFIGTGGSAAVRFFSHRVFMSAGDWVRASWKERPGTAGHRVSYSFFDDTGALLSTTTASSYYKATTDTVRTIAAAQAPNNTNYMRLRFDVYSNSSNANPANGTSIIFNNAVVAVAGTSAALADLSDAQEVLWNEEVLASCTEVNVNRVAGQVGTLTARVVSNALDPAFNDLLRPGRRMRLEYLTGDTNAQRPLFTGFTGRPEVEYSVRNGRQHTVTTLTCYDAFQVLASTPQPDGYRRIDYLRSSFENAVTPVPWVLNGVDFQGETYTPDATDPSATLLDQVIRTRDTNLAAAWTDIYGRVNLWDHSHHNTTVRDTYTEADYNAAVKVSWDVDRCINSASGNNLVGTASTPFGPARNRASIAEWGELTASFTTINAPNPGDLALTVVQGNGGTLRGNADPIRMIESVSFAMATLADIDRIGPRDLWDLVHASNATFGLGDDYRISSINHSLKAGGGDGDKWLVTFGFDVANRVSMPTV